MSRAATCGSAIASTIVRTRPHGTLCASSRSISSCSANRSNVASSSVLSALRLASRSALVANRASPRQVVSLDRRAELLPQPRIAHRDDDLSVAGLQRLVRRDGRMIVADPLRRVAGREQDPERQPHHRQHRVEQRDVHVLAEPGAMTIVQGQQDALHGIQPGEIVGDRDAGARRLAVRRAGGVHEAGLALQDDVVAREIGARAILPVAADRAVDQPRIDPGHIGIAEAQVREAARDGSSRRGCRRRR